MEQGCFRSRLIRPSDGPARARALARRPFGLASAAPRLMVRCGKAKKPTEARQAIEARPLGRARAGPRSGI